MWAGYDSTEDGLLHRLPPETSPRCARAARSLQPRACFVDNTPRRRSRPRQVSRVQAAWDAVERSFLDQLGFAEDIVDTIMPGMPRRHLEELAAFLGRVRKAPSSPLHPDIELLYRLRGGQVVYVSPCCPVVEGLDYRAPDERELCTFPMGLFGGHFFYGQMPAFDSCVGHVLFIRDSDPRAARGTPPVAADHGGTGDGDGLVVCVDTRDGVPYMCDRSVFGPGLIDGAGSRRAQTTVLGWFQQYRPWSPDGVYAPRDVSNLHPSFRKMMWRYPASRSACGWIISGFGDRGVRAAGNDPRQSRPCRTGRRRDRGHPTLHTYSVRMDILSEEEQRRRWSGDPAVRTFASRAVSPGCGKYA